VKNAQEGHARKVRSAQEGRAWKVKSVQDGRALMVKNAQDGRALMVKSVQEGRAQKVKSVQEGRALMVKCVLPRTGPRVRRGTGLRANRGTVPAVDTVREAAEDARAVTARPSTRMAGRAPETAVRVRPGAAGGHQHVRRLAAKSLKLKSVPNLLKATASRNGKGARKPAKSRVKKMLSAGTA
jgi:hypothetical protein